MGKTARCWLLTPTGFFRLLCEIISYWGPDLPMTRLTNGKVKDSFYNVPNTPYTNAPLPAVRRQSSPLSSIFLVAEALVLGISEQRMKWVCVSRQRWMLGTCHSSQGHPALSESEGCCVCIAGEEQNGPASIHHKSIPDTLPILITWGSKSSPALGEQMLAPNSVLTSGHA